MKDEEKGEGRAKSTVTKNDGGRQQWNAVDEVTHMPEAIRRLWLLCYHDFDPSTPTPTHILPTIYSTMHHNNRNMSSTCDWAVRCVKTKIPTRPCSYSLNIS